MHSSILEHVSHYITLNAEEKRLFVKQLKEVKLPKKAYLIEPGSYIDHEYYVVKGCLKAYYLDDDGNKHILQFAIEDWWIGDFDAFYNEVPSKLFIEAIEDCTLLSLQRKDLEFLFEEVPKFERFFRLIVTRAFIAHRKRILSSLEKSGKNRYLDFCTSYPSIEQRVANYHIANYLGLKPQSLSRIRKEIAEQG